MSEQPRFMLIASSKMESDPAFHRAAALAKAQGAALHIVAFDYLEGLVTASLVNDQVREVMRENYMARHRRWLEDQAEPIRKSGLTVTTEVVWVEDALDEILAHVREQPMDALIKSLEYQSRLSRMIVTPLDIHLLRECTTPLHFVSHVRHAMPRRILVAVDPFHRDGRYRDFNDRILHEALKLATACDAEIDVLYAYDLSSISAAEFGLYDGSAFFSSKAAKTLFDAQGEAFNDLADRNGISGEQRHMVMGAPASVLASFVSAHDIDLMVMGRVGHPDAGHLVGSTVENLLYRAPCSMWVVAPEFG